MHTLIRSTGCALALAAAAALGASTALADKPSKSGKDKHYKEQEREQGREPRFDEHQQMVVQEYYGKEFKSGKCPPGLKKKHNGCMPPGQAKKWRRGEPLPRDVVYYDLPPKLVVEIGVPPAGYRYVRVASDILMIAVGTAMVVDAIEDLHTR
jgi:Ni/Co efflux regulator RcnB